MKKMILYAGAAAMCLGAYNANAQHKNAEPVLKEVRIRQTTDSTLNLQMQLQTKLLRVKAGQAIEIVPQLYDSLHAQDFPRIVLNGSRRHKLYLRQAARGNDPYPQETDTVLLQGNNTELLKYNATVTYRPWMEKATFRLRKESCGCPGTANKPGEIPSGAKVATLPPAKPAQESHTLLLSFVEPAREEVKTRSEYGDAYLNFLPGKWEILYDYKDNARKLDQVQAFFRQAQEDRNITVEGIRITGYASPEGTYESNLRLSRNRASAFASWVQERFRFPREQYTADWKGEDWEKLRTLVQESSMPDKYAVTDIIDNYGVFQGRENRLMKLDGGRTYKYMLLNLFPQLRRVYYRIDYTVRPFTVEESREMIKTKPQQLSVFEIYSAANTYHRGSKEYNTVITKAGELFPGDPAAANNAAAVALQEGRTQDAKKLLDQTPDSPARQNNLGVYYLLTGDALQARIALEKALKGGIEDARGNLEIVNRQLEADRERAGKPDGEQNQPAPTTPRQDTDKRKAVPYKVR